MTRSEGFKKRRVQGFEDSRGQKSEGVEDSRVQGVRKAKGSRIQGFKGSSGKGRGLEGWRVGRLAN